MKKKTVLLPNGETYSYLEQGSGDNVLLLIHGNFSSSVHYSPLLERLPKDVRVVAPDLRGYGDSTYYRRINSLDDFADDIEAFMSALDINRAVVVGWSLGGGVALKLAARHQKLVSKLVLINSTTHRGYPVFKKDENGQMLIGQVYSSPEEMGTDPIQVLPLLEAQKNGDEKVIDFIFDQTIYTHNKPSKEDNELWVKESLKQRNLIDADWALANLNMSAMHNFYHPGTNDITSVKVPVLHTMGKKDIIVPEYMILENIKALEEYSTLITYEDCGHSPFVDVPDQITKDILKFAFNK